MAKFDLKFICDHDSREADFIKARLEKGDNDYPIDTILITACMDGQENFIFLDKSTAIKFAKTLRTEINKITESEVNNG